MDHIFLIHSSVDGHLGCFHGLAVTNSAAWIFCSGKFCLDRCPGVGLLGPMVVVYLVFWGCKEYPIHMIVGLCKCVCCINAPWNGFCETKKHVDVSFLCPITPQRSCANLESCQSWLRSVSLQPCQLSDQFLSWKTILNPLRLHCISLNTSQFENLCMCKTYLVPIFGRSGYIPFVHFLVFYWSFSCWFVGTLYMSKIWWWSR